MKLIFAFIILLILLILVNYFYKSESQENNNDINNTNDNQNRDLYNDFGNDNDKLDTPEELIVKNNVGMDIMIEARCTIINQNRDLYNDFDNNDLIIGGPIPGYKSNYLLKNNEIIKFKIPDEGLASLKLWAKFYKINDKWLMGQSMQDWDDQKKASIGGCNNSVFGCTPPIDTIFEATFGCKYDDKSLCAKNPSNMNETLLSDTFFDISHVDGYTLPYKLEIIGDYLNCDKNSNLGDNNNGLKEIDGSKLTLDKCPDENKLYLSYIDSNSNTVNELVGCMSPCQALTSGLPFGKNYTANPNDNVKIFSEDAVKYCCPTPSEYLLNDGTNNVNKDCTIKNGCTSSTNCGDLGIKETNYYKLIKKIVTNNYAYAYDDSNGLHTCPRKNIKYVLTFLPPKQ